MLEPWLVQDGDDQDSDLFLPNETNHEGDQRTPCNADESYTKPHPVAARFYRSRNVGIETQINKKECSATLRNGRKCSNAVKTMDRWTCDIGAHKAQEADILQTILQSQNSAGLLSAVDTAPLPSPLGSATASPNVNLLSVHNLSALDKVWGNDMIKEPVVCSSGATPAKSQLTPPAIPLGSKPKRLTTSSNISASMETVPSAPFAKLGKTGLAADYELCKSGTMGYSDSAGTGGTHSGFHHLQGQKLQQQSSQCIPNHGRPEVRSENSTLSSSAVARVLRANIANARRMQQNLQQRIEEMESALEKIDHRQWSRAKLAAALPTALKKEATDDESERGGASETDLGSVCESIEDLADELICL